MKWEVIIPCVAGAISVLGGIWAFFRRLAILEYKVDTMWEFLLRRGKVEGVKKGLFTINSPIMLTQAARERFEKISTELVALYKHCARCDDATIAMKIEQEFGEYLVREVCEPMDVHESACLIAALVFCKERLGLAQMDHKEKKAA